MAISASVTVGGVVRAVWEDDVEQYREFAADGVTVTLGPRAYTAVELAQKAERTNRTTQLTNSVTLRDQIAAGITALTADVTDLNAVAGQGAPATLAVMWTRYQLLAAGLKRTDKALIGLARIVSGQLGSADTGV